MSCQIKGIAYLIDPTEVKLQLLQGTSVKLDHVSKDELPLQECFISLSPSGDVLAMAFAKNIVILTSKWDLQEPGEIKNKFHITWSGTLTQEPSEFITSVLCLPLITLGKSSTTNAPDWTCIVVGFSSGYLRFYTEYGALLHQEQLHNENIIAIKCQSSSRPRHTGEVIFSEELHVFYSSVVCILTGFPLFSTLKACRNHLARVQANCNDKAPSATLSYKKLGYKDQDVINDGQVVGTTSVNTFDHLMTASICGGFHANYRSSAPQHSLIMATGKRPFIGYHFALEGGSAPVLSDVALAMANSLASAIGKIGTAVPWFRGSTKAASEAEKPKTPVIEQAEAMTCRFGLSDIMREGDSLVTCPNKTLSVVTDTMGRVLLVHNRRGVALRMWKGYRDAQCGWIEVTEDKHRGAKVQGQKMSAALLRTALFLVIYAPKKGIIDIWSVQQGGKITTFSASKNGRLLYVNYGLLGFNDGMPSFQNKPEYSCVFFDPLGGLKEITVPFHFSLTSQNGKRARDVHLFKKLKTFIREEDFTNEKLISEVMSVCSELNTNEIRLQIIEMLITNRRIIPDAVLTAVNCFIKVLIQFEEGELEHTGKSLYHLSVQLQKAVEFYKYVRLQFDQPPEYSTVVAYNIPDVKELVVLLNTSEREINRIFELSKTLYEYKPTKPQVRVKFEDDGDLFSNFLGCFDFEIENCVTLTKDLTADKKYQLASLIYQGWLYSNESITDWQDAATQSNIKPRDLMELSLVYWLNKRPGAPLAVELMKFTELLQSICALAEPEDLSVDYNELSSWWRDIRNILIGSTKPFQALTAALGCRSVLITLQKHRDGAHNDCKDDNGNQVNDDTKEVENLSSDWVNVSQGTCQFSLLIGNLEDVAILNSVLSESTLSDETTKFYALPYEKLEVSLGIIVAKGKGSVSETVARWLASSGVNPELFIDKNDVEFNQMTVHNIPVTLPHAMDDIPDANVSSEDQECLQQQFVETDKQTTVHSTATTKILDDLSHLKRHFPYSLSSSVLLTNLTWQFVMFWSKDVSKLDVLTAALETLKLIPMKSMKHGVCCLLWNIHLKKRMESAAKLMNKLGKLPKERLCIQDIGLSDLQTVEFLGQCAHFFDIFLDCELIEEEEGAKGLIIKSEELWEGQANGPEAFATMAVTQSPAGYDLVMIHLQLAHILHMMAYFNLKSLKPLNNIFESITSRYFFQDITNKVVLAWYHDEKRDNLRLDFLCRVITATMESIHRETSDINSLSSTQAIQWMSKCQTLASIWKINSDKLRIHQVCQLYINGFDRLAEEVFTAVNDTETLAESLLPIAGRRMMAYLSKTPDLLEEVSRISPALTLYLENLNGPEVLITNCSNEETIELVKKISRYLPEVHSCYHCAQMMLDATFIYESS